MRSYCVTLHFPQRGPFEVVSRLRIEAESLLEAAGQALGDPLAWSGDQDAERVTVERFDENWQQVERGSWLIVPGDPFSVDDVAALP